MKFVIDLALDLARDLAVVTLAIAGICAAGWMVLGRQDSESDSKTVPMTRGASSEKDGSKM